MGTSGEGGGVCSVEVFEGWDNFSRICSWKVWGGAFPALYAELQVSTCSYYDWQHPG